MKQRYTIRQWLQLLEPEIRKMAIANIETPDCQHPGYSDDMLLNSLDEAIIKAFVWHYTPQGWDYWAEQHTFASKNNRTPTAFMDIDCTVPE